uniref:Uncharacterized protein n=1 Tax=Acrobeloides nanus TaxID=290746 RepID=A0A914DT95_9BILA
MFHSCETCHCKYEKERFGLKPFSEWWRWPRGHVTEFHLTPEVCYKAQEVLFFVLYYFQFMLYDKELVVWSSLAPYSAKVSMALDSIFTLACIPVILAAHP